MRLIYADKVAHYDCVCTCVCVCVCHMSMQTELRSLLKRQYADTISALQEEFSRKRSKGKLPDDATSVLREWWNAHFTWPYPDVSG